MTSDGQYIAKMELKSGLQWSVPTAFFAVGICRITLVYKNNNEASKLDPAL